jgi:hypothetical protein
MDKIKRAFKILGGKFMEIGKSVAESRERTIKYVLSGLKDPNNRLIAGIIIMATGIGIGGGLCISSVVEGGLYE